MAALVLGSIVLKTTQAGRTLSIDRTGLRLVNFEQSAKEQYVIVPVSGRYKLVEPDRRDASSSGWEQSRC
jgi:hypothetical protein